MSIYFKLFISFLVFFFALYFAAYPGTPWANWLEKKTGDYNSALITSSIIGAIPMLILGLVYMWIEL